MKRTEEGRQKMEQRRQDARITILDASAFAEAPEGKQGRLRSGQAAQI